MKSVLILVLLAVLLFNVGYAAPPINLQNNPDPLLPLQTLKATKLNLLDFIQDILSTMGDNLKNQEDVTKGLNPPHLFMTMIGKLISGVRKDTVAADPNNMFAPIMFDSLNTFFSEIAKDFDKSNGEMQSKN